MKAVLINCLTKIENFNYKISNLLEMPSNANVVIQYGPYRSNGIVDYRQDRLLGLQSILFFERVLTVEILTGLFKI